MSDLKSQYANYLAIDLLEKLGNPEPTEAQITLLEAVLTKIMLIQPIFFDQRLTNQETVCLYWAAMGKTSTETATFLNIQPGTVEQHRQEVKRKLNCKSIAEAVFRGIQFGHLRSEAFHCGTCQQVKSKQVK